MISNHRKPIIPIRLYDIYYLSGRISLSSPEKNHFYRLQKGFLGELAFHQLSKPIISSRSQSLYSLSLQTEEGHFQIDHLYLFPDKIYLHEIKNFTGDYTIQNNQWFHLPSNKEINNPFIQLKRTESYFRQFLRRHGFQHEVISNVVFIQDAFVLYHASPQLPLLFRSQLEGHVKQITSQTRSSGTKERDLAEQLTSRHKENTSFRKPIAYTYDQMNKGVNCPQCMKMMIRVTQRMLHCRSCSFLGHNKQMLLFNIRQFQHLFPNEKLTSSIIYDWCGGLFSLSSIRGVLHTLGK